jgi:ATP-dependent Clp protease ATP-binding subunit ClpC
MSSNIGAREMSAALQSGFGFQGTTIDATSATVHQSLDKIGNVALAKQFPPEFPNRIDEIITYRTLDDETLRLITVMEMKKAERHIINRLGLRSFHLVYGKDVLDHITEVGTSRLYGARELKRAITRLLLNPLADDYIDEKIQPGSRVFCRVDGDKIVWDIEDPVFTINPDGTVRFIETPETPEASAANN